MPEIRVSQLPVSVVQATIATEPRVSQVPINVVFLEPQPARISQAPLEVAFPFEPLAPRALIPARPVVETWAWRTSVFKSLYGFETRMALRAGPFVGISYNLPLRSEEDRRNLRYMLHRYTGKRLNYPLFQFSTPLTATASISDTALVFDPTETNVRTGEPVAIFNDDLSFYRLYATGSVTGTGINLAGGLPEELVAGLYVAPAPRCRFADGQTLRMGTFFGEATFNLEVMPPRVLLRPDQIAALTTYDGWPILPDQFISGSEGGSEQILSNLNTMDTGLNEPNDQQTWITPQLITSRAYRVDPSDLDVWRKFGDTVKGSQKPFLLPSFRKDFTLSAPPALGATEFVTEDTFVADYFSHEMNRYIRIETANGVIYRKVIDARLNLDNTVALYLNTAIGSSAGDNVFERISLVHKVRLADDTITLTHNFNYTLVSFGAVGIND